MQSLYIFCPMKILSKLSAQPRALLSAQLFPDVSGRVVAVRFTPGGFVREGAVLLELDSRQERLALQLADVRVEEAEQLLGRYRRIEDTGALSESQIEEDESALAAAVASQYVELQRSAARLQLLDQSTDLQRQTLQIVSLRFTAGLPSNLDVRRAAADLAQTQAQRGALFLAQACAAHALAVLTGEPPSSASAFATDGDLPRFGRGPDIGLPADLLRRRPDLLLTEGDIAEAAANVGIERADLLPAFTIPGILSLGDASAPGILTQALAGLSAVLDVPLLDGSRRRAEVCAAKRQLDAERTIYRQILLEVQAEKQLTRPAHCGPAPANPASRRFPS